MSSPHKIFFHTPTKKSIRNQFIKQENNKKKINERSQENISKSNIKEMSQKDYCKKNQIINVTRRSLTPQPSIAKHKYNYFDEDKSVINSQISKRSLTPNARIKKIDCEIRNDITLRKSSHISKTPDSKEKNEENLFLSTDILLDQKQEQNYSIMEREKLKLHNNFIRNMSFLDHKYKNCPCYKCLCGKCFCPMRQYQKNGPFINSTYKQDYLPKNIINDECPYKKLQGFQYKPQNECFKNFTSTYKDFFKEHPLISQKPIDKKKKYEKSETPLFSNTNYNENYKDWSKYKDNKKDQGDMMNPLNNLSPIPAPLMNKTTYRDCFRSKSPAANVNEFENLLKSKRDKNVKNPLSTNFRSPFETENQAKFKKYEITKVPSRIEKKVSNNMDELPKTKYETDYSKNYRFHRLKPFVCPARVELDRLAFLEAQLIT